MNRKNLKKLAAYLEGLPDDYEHFGMRDYMVDGEQLTIYPAYSPLAGACGTIACAIGHGPAAGIFTKRKDDCWADYGQRVFGLTEHEYVWCFDGGWTTIDNTAQGAAKRIRYMLEHGVPENSDDQWLGIVPYQFGDVGAEA